MPAAPSRRRCIVPLGRCSLALDDDRRPLVPASKSHVVNALIRDLAGNCDLASSFSHDGRRTSMRSLEPRRYGSSTRMFCACAPPYPHPAASKYPCSSSSSSLANSSHRLGMSSSCRLLLSSMVFESRKQVAVLCLYSCAAVAICTPLLSCTCADEHLATIWVPRPRSSCFGLSRSLVSHALSASLQGERGLPNGRQLSAFVVASAGPVPSWTRGDSMSDELQTGALVRTSHNRSQLSAPRLPPCAAHPRHRAEENRRSLPPMSRMRDRI